MTNEARENLCNAIKHALHNELVWFMINENGCTRKILGTLMPHLIPEGIKIVEKEGEVNCFDWPHKTVENIKFDQVIGLVSDLCGDKYYIFAS